MAWFSPGVSKWDIILFMEETFWELPEKSIDQSERNRYFHEGQVKPCPIRSAQGRAFVALIGHQWRFALQLLEEIPHILIQNSGSFGDGRSV